MSLIKNKQPNQEPVMINTFSNSRNYLLLPLEHTPKSIDYDLIHYMGSFDGLPVYTFTKNESTSIPAKVHHLEREVLQNWVYGLMENYPSLDRNDLKTYVMETLNVSMLSDYDSIID